MAIGMEGRFPTPPVQLFLMGAVDLDWTAWNFIGNLSIPGILFR
jgi:hypothetical protein